MTTSIRNHIAAIESAFLKLEGTSAIPHNMGGREFVWHEKEIGHIHWNGDLDILFNKRVRDQLLEKKLAEIHKWVPESGWTTFRVLRPEDIEHASYLLNFSFLLKAKKLDFARFEQERNKLLAKDLETIVY
jgi:hypothetical protein